MKKETFKLLITESVENEYKFLYDRDVKIIETKLITTITGPRRCGKTSLMLKLLEEKRKIASRNRCVYINFEDDRLYPLELSDLQDFIDTYYELYPDNKKEQVYLFLDEIQVVPQWELFIRRIYDKENIRLYLSGSSSKLLSSEIATSLRGRTITVEMFPLSFAEYLSFNKVKQDIYSAQWRPRIINLLDNYLLYGGFPELTGQPKELHFPTLSEYFNMILYRDLIERYNIANPSLLKIFLRHCVRNPATLLSMTKTVNDFKSMGLSTSRNTLYDYFDYFQECYSLFTVSVYRKSFKEQQVNPKKIYVVDNGFYSAHQFNPDKGKLYENVVFLHLRRFYKEIFYYKGKKEVDFCFETNDGIQLINVSYDLSNRETKEREINGLCEAMETLSVKQSQLITSSLEETLETPSGRIQVIPLYKWLLQLKIES
jgi:Predicted ATPase (AAA+ superfamily)